MDIIGVVEVFVDLGFTAILKSQVISVAFESKLEKFDKFWSEALISAWGSSACRKYTTRDSRRYFPSEGSHTQDFYALKKIHRPRPGLNPRTLNPVASMITAGPSGRDIIGMFESFNLTYIIMLARRAGSDGSMSASEHFQPRG